ARPPGVAAPGVLARQGGAGEFWGSPPTGRSNRIAAGTIGTFAGPAGQPMLCSSSQRTVPVAASRPNALPPDRTTAFTLSTMFSGLRRSVSRVPGAPPRWLTPPTASPSTRITVQPVGRSASVWWPTLMPSTAVSPNPARGVGCAPRLVDAAAHPNRKTARFIRLQYRNVTGVLADRLCAEVDRAADELVQLAADLVRIPTVNPPGEAYDACAHLVGDDLRRRG